MELLGAQHPKTAFLGTRGDMPGPVLPVGRRLGQEVGAGAGSLAQGRVQALGGGGFLGLAEG